MKMYLEVEVSGAVEDVFKRFDRGLFEAITPAPVRHNMKRFDGCNVGDRFHFKILMGDWIGVISERKEQAHECYFVDEGIELPAPLTFWRHRHIVRSSNTGTLIVDEIEYKTKNTLIDAVLRPVLWCFFKARHPLYKRYFLESHP